MKTPKIHREGRGLICGTVLLLFIINVPIYLFVQPHWVFAITLIITAMLLVFVTYFFRNPVRVLKIDDPNFIIAPADGRVVVIEPTEENEYFHEKKLQVSIFMSPLTYMPTGTRLREPCWYRSIRKVVIWVLGCPNRVRRTSAVWWLSRRRTKCRLLFVR